MAKWQELAMATDGELTHDQQLKFAELAKQAADEFIKSRISG